MKLVRYGAKGAKRPGLIDADGALRDLSGVLADLDAAAMTPESLARIAAVDPSGLPRVDGNPRFGAPIANPPKIVCIGLNYADHAAETGSPIPETPVVFMKAPGSLNGPNDDVIMPKGSTHSDWEVELAIVIGAGGRYIPKDKAMDAVAGYCVFNDVSERDLQKTGGAGQWVKGKALDTYGPTGPWMVTKDEIGDIGNLDMWLDVNGARMQTGNTRTMIFDVPTIVSHLSEFMTLTPGDIIPTGTPPGVGLGFKPPKFLKGGDVMTLGIQGLGEQRQTIRAWKD